MALIAHYKLDGNENDSVGGYHGVVSGTVNYINAKIGQGFSTDATPGYITTTINDQQFATDFSASAWVRIKAWGTSKGVFGTRNPPNGWMLYRNSVDSDGLLRFYMHYKNTDDVDGTFSRTYSSFPLDEWFHVVVVRGRGWTEIWFNGNKVASGNLGSNFKYWNTNSPTPLRIGAGGSGWATEEMDIDDVRIYDHALSPREVRDLAQAKVLHYKFDNFAEPTENLLADGISGYNAFTAAHWNGSVTDTGQVSPFGVPILEYVVGTTSSVFTHDYVLDDDFAKVSEQTVTWSIYLRRVEGAAGARIRIYDNVSGYSYFPISATTSFQRFEVSKTCGLNPTRVFVMIDNTGGGTYQFYAPQLEVKPYATPFVDGTRDGVVTDASSQDNHATLALATTPQWVEDSKIGSGAYEYKLGNDIYASSPSSNFGNTISAAAWINPESADGRAPIVKIDRFYFQFYGGSSLATYWYGRDPSGYHYLSGTTIPLNQWSHVAVVWSETDVKFYVNGTLANTVSSVLGIGQNNDFFRVGYENASRRFAGKIDDVRVYASALSVDEIQEIYQQRASLDSGGSFHVQELGQQHPVGGDLVLHLDPASPRCFQPSDTKCYNLVSGQPVLGAVGSPGAGDHVGDPSNFPAYNSLNNGIFDYAGGKGMNVQEDLGSHSELTLCMWFYYTGGSTDYFTDARANGGQWFLSNYSGENINYTHRLKYNFSPTYDASDPDFIQQWYFMVAMSNSSQSWLFLNGEEVSPYVSSLNFNTTLGKNFRIGTRYTTSGQWTGYFGPILAYSRLLKGEEILHNYNYAKDRFL